MFKILQEKCDSLTKEPVKTVLITIAKAIIVSILFYDSLLFSLMISPILPRVIKNAKQRYDNEQRARLSREFKDALTSLAFSIGVGYSVENAIKESARELELIYGSDSRMVTELRKMHNRVQMNEPVEQAFEHFANESGNDDVKYFSQILTIAKRSGGNLSAIIQDSAERIGQKIQVKQEIETIVSGKQMEQKIMSYVPFLMVGYLRLTSTELVSALYGNVLGICLMTLCLIVCLVANYIATRLLDIRV